MTLDELNKIIRDTIRLVLPSLTEVIAYYPNAPRPDGSYATVNVAAIAPIGNGERVLRENADDVINDYYIQYSAMISVNFYRKGARQNAGLFLGELWREEVISEWNLNGIGFIDSSDVRDLTELLNQDHEERAQVDVNVHFLLTHAEENLPGINAARILGKFDNGQRVVEEVEINVN